MTDATRGPASGTAGAAESASVDRTLRHRDGDRGAANSDRRCSDLRPTRPADRCHIRQPSAGSGRGGGPPAPIAGDDRQDRHRRRVDDCGARHDGRVRHRRPGGRQQTGAVAARRNRLARTSSGVAVARDRATGRQCSHVDRATAGDRRRDRWRHGPAGCRRLRPVDVGSDAPRRCRRDPGDNAAESAATPATAPAPAAAPTPASAPAPAPVAAPAAVDLAVPAPPPPPAAPAAPAPAAPAPALQHHRPQRRPSHRRPAVGADTLSPSVRADVVARHDPCNDAGHELRGVGGRHRRRLEQ